MSEPRQFQIAVVRVNESVPGPRGRYDWARIEGAGEFIWLFAVLSLAAEESPDNSKGRSILKKAASNGLDQPKLEVVWLAAEKLRTKGIEVRYVRSVFAWSEDRKPEKLIISVETHKTRRKRDRRRAR